MSGSGSCPVLLLAKQRCWLAKIMAVFAVALFATAAGAHGLAIELMVEGATLRGAARYTDRSPVARESVAIFSPPESQTPIGSAVTASDGRFSFQGMPGRTYRVTIDAGEGHQVEGVVTIPASATLASGAAAIGLTRTELDAALLPLREDLARLERQWRMTDLFAGLGYVFGIYGLVTWLRVRKP